VGEERDPAPEDESSVTDLLDEWRAAERDAAAEEPGSAAQTMAKHRADLARDAFHEREDEEHVDYGDLEPRHQPGRETDPS
jgi:hypothetical protein